MKNSQKDKEQLLSELKILRKRIAELEWAEHSLKNREEKFRAISEQKNMAYLENSPACTKIIDLDFKLQFMSRSGYESLHIDNIAEYYGKPYPLDFYPDSLKKPMTQNLKKAKVSGEIITLEAPVVDVYGHELWFHSTIIPVKDDKDNIEYLMVVSIDTTKRRIAEKKLQDALDMTAIAEQAGKLGFWSWKPISNQVQWSDNMCRIHGIEPSEFIASFDYASSFQHFDDRDYVKRQIKDMLTDKKSIPFEFRIITPAGEIKFLEGTNQILFDENNEIKEIIGTIQDISERKLAEKEIKDSKENLAIILNSIGDAVMATDREGRITQMNPVAEKLTGYKLADAQTCLLSEIFKITNASTGEISPIPVENVNNSCVVVGQTFHYVLLARDGLKRQIEVQYSPIENPENEIVGVVLVFRDISQRKIMEKQLEQAGKMATLGEMAAGIAHEINQPLSVIQMATQLTAMAIETNDYTADFLVSQMQKVRENTDRATNIINHLRTFGRKAQEQFSEVDINQVIRKAIDMMGQHIKIHAIELKLDLQTDLPLVKGNANTLEQVFINLIVNARDAVDSAPVYNAEPKKIAIKSRYIESQKSLELLFMDSGSGIPLEDHQRIFEPFYTTKIEGKGTGLGLSISYSIIKRHNGDIFVEQSQPGCSGACFCIELPVVETN